MYIDITFIYMTVYLNINSNNKKSDWFDRAFSRFNRSLTFSAPLDVTNIKKKKKKISKLRVWVEIVTVIFSWI